MLAPCLYLWLSHIFYWLPAYHYGTLLPSPGPLPIPMVLYHLLLPPVLNLWYSSTCTYYLLPAYTYGTFLPLLAPCLYLWYSSIFFWLPAYPYGTPLPSTGPLPIPMVLYYLPMAPFLSLWYSTIFYCPTAYTYGILLIVCLSLWYCITVYSLSAYTYGNILSSNGPLSIPLVLYDLLLAPCLYLC